MSNAATPNVNPTNTKFKKGDEIFEIGSWDGKGTVYVRRLTLQSWGKQQGTATYTLEGKLTKARIYTQGGSSFLRYFPITTNIEIEALKLAEIILTWQTEHYNGCIKNNAETYNNLHYQRHMKEELAALHEPRITYREGF